MLVIDFAKSSEGEFVKEDIQCKRSPCRLFIVVITVQDHTCVFLDTETGQYLRKLTMKGLNGSYLLSGPRHPRIFFHLHSNVFDAASLFYTIHVVHLKQTDWFEKQKIGGISEKHSSDSAREKYRGCGHLVVKVFVLALVCT